MNGPELILHLPLDRIDDPKTMDVSARRRMMSIAGHPETTADPIIGSAAHFHGQEGMTTTLSGLGKGNPAFTLSAWIRVDFAPEEISRVFSIGGREAGSFQLVVSQDGTLDAGVDGGAVMGEEIPTHAWRHWTVRHDGKAMTLLLDGERVAGPKKVKLDLPYAVLRIAQAENGRNAIAGFTGAMAHVRLHAGVVDDSALRAMISSDRTPRAVLHNDNPLDCRLLDTNDKPTLFIEDHVGGEELAVEVTNVSSRPVVFNPVRNKRATIMLTFRPDTLTPSNIRRGQNGLAIRETRDWDLMPLRPVRDGTVQVSLRWRHKGKTLEPGEAVVVTFENIAAAPGEGARVSRVEFDYHGFAFGDGSKQQITGSRVKTINIASHVGRPHAPLRFAFRDQGQIIPGAHIGNNKLEFSLINTAQSRPLRFLPTDGEFLGSELVLIAEGENNTESKPTALCKMSEEAPIRITPPKGWDWTLESEDKANPKWVFRPKSTVNLLPGKRLDFTLSNITSSTSPGRAPVRLIHRRIPGFWAGEHGLEVDKSPLHFDNKGNVGVGVNAPTHPLDVAVDDDSGWLSFRTSKAENARVRADAWVLAEKNDGLAIQRKTTTRDRRTRRTRTKTDDRLFLGRDYYGIGIGTATPEPGWNLHIDSTQAANLLMTMPKNSGGSPIFKMEGGGGEFWARFDDGQRGKKDALLQSFGKGMRLEAKQLTLKATEDGGVLGADSKGIWVGKSWDKRSSRRNQQQFQVRGSIGVEGTMFADGGMLIGKKEQRGYSFGVSRLRYSHGSSAFGDFKSNYFDNDYEFLNVMGRYNGVLTVNPGGGERLPRLYWSTSGVNVIRSLNVDGMGFSDSAFNVDVKADATIKSGGKTTIESGNFVELKGVMVRALSTFTAPNKWFSIPHPQDPSRTLNHGCLEGPENGVYYRGEAQLSGGEATIALPAYFESLTRREGRTVLLTAKGRKPFLLSYEDVRDGRFTVYGTEPDGTFSWEVRAVRSDVDPLDVEPEG